MWLPNLDGFGVDQWWMVVAGKRGLLIADRLRVTNTGKIVLEAIVMGRLTLEMNLSHRYTWRMGGIL